MYYAVMPLRPTSIEKVVLADDSEHLVSRPRWGQDPDGGGRMLIAYGVTDDGEEDDTRQEIFQAGVIKEMIAMGWGSDGLVEDPDGVRWTDR